MPEVSIVVPCYNEEKTIELLLQAIYEQTYPRRKMEVLIADGLSTDGTQNRIMGFQRNHQDLDIRIVENPQRTIPAGLNKAIQKACGKWIVRLDAHSKPASDYVERIIDALEKGVGDSVGGVWDIRPQRQDWQARAIALAAAHPLAVGDALYRYARSPKLVETVPFGAFQRSWVDRIGFFDETLLTNEDYEFNVRLRNAGGKIWLDPAIRSVYFARSKISELASQYWRYGYWKMKMLRRHPGSLRWRQALPPVFISSLILLIILSPVLPIARTLFVIEFLTYVTVLLLAGIQLAWKHRDLTLIAGIPIAIFVMHFCWGSAFLWSFIGR